MDVPFLFIVLMYLHESHFLWGFDYEIFDSFSTEIGLIIITAHHFFFH